MKRYFKHLYHNTVLGKYIIRRALYFFGPFWSNILPDEDSIKRKFKKKMGYEIDLKNPRTLNEKINWLKLNDRTPLHTQCADKYAVRSYIKEKIGEEYLVPLLFTTRNPKDISPDLLPEVPFIIKTNHNSGGSVIVRNKEDINWPELQSKLKRSLGRNYYKTTNQWQYKDIVPCVVVEKLLPGENGNLPFDYKLHCFNGKVNMIQVDVGRNSDNHYRNWYNVNWEREPYRWSAKKGKNKFTDPSVDEVEKPASLNRMIKLSETIAKDFIYVRVDWYDINGALYFGEITFHQDSGYRAILPIEWDRTLGDKLILPLVVEK